MFKLILIIICINFLISGCSFNSSKTNTPANFNNTTFAYELDNFNTKKIVEPKEEELSSYSSPILIDDSNRQTNVELTCTTLNGTIVKSQQEFSFCNTLGPATPQNGYKKAEIFDSDGDITLDYGGGKCQVSSTLYNAVLSLDSLEVTERAPHSHNVDYVPEGKDATVAYGSVDFKFINHNNFDIKIIAESTKENVTIKILKIL